jgi:hypothetical protein
MNAGANPGAHTSGLTPELVAELEKDHTKVAQLSEEQLRALLEDEDEPGESPAPAAQPQAPVAPAAQGAAAPTAPAPVKDEKPASPAPDSVDGETYRRKADELNTIRQAADKRERELAEARRLATENEARAKELEERSKSRKTIEDERLKRLEDENRSLRTENATVLKSRVDTLDEEQKTARVNREFLEIETFQMHSPRLGVDLRTKRPFRELDTEVGAMEAALGKDTVKRMQTDKAFRDQMAAQGHKLPDEWEKWRTVMLLHGFKKGANSLKQAYPSYTSAFVDFSQESGFLQKAVHEAALDASRETAEKLIQRSTETSLLPAASGSGGGAHHVDTSKWNPESAAKWMRNHPTPKSEEERATQMEILKWMEDNDIE